MTQWVDSIGLGEYSAHLKEGGVHSGVIVLDREFDYEKLSLHFCFLRHGVRDMAHALSLLRLQLYACKTQHAFNFVLSQGHTALSWGSGRGLLEVYWGWTDAPSAGDQEEVY